MTIHKTVRLYDGDASGLDYNKIFKALQGLAVDNARSKFDGLTISAVTDSTTGTAATVAFTNTAIVAVAKPAPFTNGSSTSNAVAQKTAFDTSMGKLANAAASLANYLNPYLGELGYDPIVIPSAVTITAAVPALDLTSTGSTTTGSVDASTGSAQINNAKNNFSTVLLGINRVARALGFSPLLDNTGGNPDSTEPLTIIANATTAASVDASVLPSLGKTATDAEFAALANNFATAIAFLNRSLSPAEGTTLTDSTGGTASTALPPTLVALTIPAAYTTAGTDCAPKAGFDTQVALFQNAVASMADKLNRHIAFLGPDALVTPLKDLTTGTISTTLAAEAATLAAVTGTTVCIDVVTGTTTLQAYMNNMSQLCKKVNELASFYDTITITDSSTGVVPADDSTIVAMPTTATGNDGTASKTMAATVMNTFLAAARNNTSTLAAAINALIDLQKSQPLKVVAAF